MSTPTPSPEPGRCDLCPHRKMIPGDAHIECLAVESFSDRVNIAAMLTAAPEQASALLFDKLHIRIEPTAIAKGWALWPINFDPIWVKCYTLHKLDNPLVRVNNSKEKKA